MKKLYFGLFLGLMVLGGISIFATGQKTFSENENRYLKTVSSISSTSDVESVLADQFPLRDQWLSLASSMRYACLSREINDTYIGTDGYLFDKCSEGDFNLRQYKNNLAFINKFADAYSVNGFDVVLVPSPYTILSDYLPGNAPVYDADAKYQLAQQTLNSSVVLQDLRSTFQLLTDSTQVYYRTDHHWTTRAAYAAFRKIIDGRSDAKAVEDAINADMTTVTDRFHGTLYSRVLLRNGIYDAIEAPVVSSGQSDSDILYDNAKLDTKDKYAYFLGGNIGRLDIDGTGDGNLLLVKDSFANCMVPYLAQKYKHITILDLRYFNENIAQLMNEGHFDRVMVLYEMSNFADDANLFKLSRK